MVVALVPRQSVLVLIQSEPPAGDSVRVAADGRAKRDGKYLEKLGTYNPNINPAEINLDIDGAVKWLQNGAQPTDTARAILSYKGAMMKKHLAEGVRKGALTEEQAEDKFNKWVEEKASAVTNKRDKLADAKAKAKAQALEAEKAVNEARTAAAAVVEEVVEEVTEAVEEVVETVEGAIEEATEEVTKEATEAVETVEGAIEEATEEVTEKATKAVAEETSEEAAKEEE